MLLCSSSASPNPRIGGVKSCDWGPAVVASCCMSPGLSDRFGAAERLAPRAAVSREEALDGVAFEPATLGTLDFEETLDTVGELGCAKFRLVEVGPATTAEGACRAAGLRSEFGMPCSDDFVGGMSLLTSPGRERFSEVGPRVLDIELPGRLLRCEPPATGAAEGDNADVGPLVRPCEEERFKTLSSRLAADLPIVAPTSFAST